MPRKWSDLPVRIASAVVLMAVVLFALLYHPHSFTALLVIAGYVLGREWQRLNVSHDWVFSLVGFLYVVSAIFSLYWLRNTPLPHPDMMRISLDYVWLLFAIVWGTDMGAYFVGRLIGGKKLWPSVSPQKSWSGAVGGALTAIVAAYGVWSLLSLPMSPAYVMLVALSVSAASQLGDLFQSHLKRRAGVKDSGRLIPGHGGLFDRVDGLMAAAPIYAFWVAFL
jgi:phosphatidate cytidylyltransferase